MKQYLDQGVVKKPAGFGDPGKISTQTCQVCLQDPKTYNQVESLTAPPVMFEDVKGYSNSPMHMGNNFVSDGHVCNTFCPVLQKLVDVGLKTF